MENREDEEIRALEDYATHIRKMILDIAYISNTPTHIGPALSCVDIIAVLYKCIMRIDPSNPRWNERDRFILSKGHACLTLYAILADMKFFPEELLQSVRKLNSPLEGHPYLNVDLGIDFSSGSLGNGLAAGLGMALYLKEKKSKVFVLLGDGECQEGIIWEAAITASALKTSNLIAIVDNNRFQSSGATDEIVPMSSLKNKWESMNWNTFEIDGHNIKEIKNILEMTVKLNDKPSIIIANTIKGKGVSFMENNNAWHQKQISKKDYISSVRELIEKRYNCTNL